MIPTSFHLIYLVRLHKNEAGTRSSWYTDTPIAGVNILVPSLQSQQATAQNEKNILLVVQHFKTNNRNEKSRRTFQAVLGKGCYIRELRLRFFSYQILSDLKTV